MSEKLVTVATFPFAPQAYFAKTLLDSADIECFVLDDNGWIAQDGPQGGALNVVRDRKAGQIAEGWKDIYEFDERS